MKAIKLAWLELRRFRSRWLLLLALVVSPLLFGAVLLWSTEDTYGRLDRIPVAVVNSDQPVEAAGMRIQAGRQFVQRLKATEVFDWRFVDAAQARRGLEHGDYYFTVEVPREFSATLTTAATPDPQRATLRITKNDANGYLAGIMADTAEDELHEQINAAAHDAYTRLAFGGLADVRTKLEQVAGGTDQLVHAADFGKQGVSALSDGLDGIRDSAGEVAQGARRMSEATAQLDREIADTAQLTGQQLPDAAGALARAGDIAVNNLSAVKSATAALTTQAADNRNVLEALGRRHPVITGDAMYQRAVEQSRQMSDAAGNTDAEAQRALDTARDASGQAWSLRDNIGSLDQRIQAIQAPADSLRSGTAQVAGGSSGVSTGLRTLSSGNDVLRRGADDLGEGAKRVRDTMLDALRMLPPSNPDQIGHAAEVLGSPTALHTSNLHPAHTYGRGLAPLLVSLALWGFGMSAFMLLRPVNSRALTGGLNPASLTLAAWLSPAIVGILGGLLLFGVLSAVPGLNARDPGAAIGVLCLGAATFATIAHFLRALFGKFGTMLALVLLVFQMAASGGLYPLETTPALFQGIHPILPMTYLVDGLRVGFSGGLPEHLALDCAVLGGFLVAFLVLTAIVLQRQRMWTGRRLHGRM